MAIVTFDIAQFRLRYPQFADVPDGQLEGFFEAATVLVDNTESSPIPYNPPDVNTRLIILYALVCHFATLALRDPTGMMVGTATSATEGSVSAGFTPIMNINPTESWYNQTQCGALAWRMMFPFVVGGRAYRGCFR